MRYYKADKDWNVIPCRNMLEWARWFETADRIVELTEVLGVSVSTVFLGVPHAHPQSFLLTDYDNAPLLFETMVFGPDDVIEQLTKATSEDLSSILAKFCGSFDIQKRYRNIAEARAGHKEMVDYVRAVLVSRN
jgi:hypothetical protein